MEAIVSKIQVDGKKKQFRLYVPDPYYSQLNQPAVAKDLPKFGWFHQDWHDEDIIFSNEESKAREYEFNSGAYKLSIGGDITIKVNEEQYGQDMDELYMTITSAHGFRCEFSLNRENPRMPYSVDCKSI